MKNINLIILVLHIISGYLALTGGFLVMVSKKGNKRHKLLGKIFYFSMMGVAFTSFYIAVFKEIIFLLHVGIFVFYQNYAGFQSVKNKILKPKIFDYLVLIVAFVNAIFMIVSLNTVLIVFGCISLFLIGTDIKIYYSIYKDLEIKKLTWLSRHIGMMMGAYIGAITAFLVVNIKSIQPVWLVWLAPTFILVPLMQYWTWKYTKKVLRNKKVMDVESMN